MDPDIRAIVPRCAMLLRARWAVNADLERNEGVEVRCVKSVDSKMRQWEILVPAYRMVEQAEQALRSVRVEMNSTGAAALWLILSAMIAP
jgi:hypothetical protein